MQDGAESRSEGWARIRSQHHKLHAITAMGISEQLHASRQRALARKTVTGPSSRKQAPRSTITLNDRHVLRGTTASVLLDGFGSRLRSTAGGIGFGSAQAEDEYSKKSFEVEELDIFLSHSWHAHWAMKYFTLLFYFNALPAFVVGFSSGVLACSIRFFPELEPIWNFLDFRLTTRHGCMVVGAVGFFITLFFWQQFLILIGVSVRSMFLDKVCIHQTDQEKKAAGIRAIGAILGNSDTVLVAWDPTYFSRLWCTFELAAYKYARPENAVIVLPVRIGGFIAALIFFNCGCQVVTDILKDLGLAPVSEWEYSHMINYMFSYFIASIILATFFHQYVKELDAMDHQLKEFSVRKAQCFCCSNDHKLQPDPNGPILTLPCDRELVEASIAHWHGGTTGEIDYQGGLDKFDLLIRNTLRVDIKHAFRGSRVPYCFVLLGSLWAGFYQMDRIGPPRLYHCGAKLSIGCNCTNIAAEATCTWNRLNATMPLCFKSKMPFVAACKNSSVFPRTLEVIHTVFLCYPLTIAIFIRICVFLFERLPRDWPLAVKRLINLLLAILSVAMTFALVMTGFTLLRRRDHPYHGILYMGLEAVAVYNLYKRADTLSNAVESIRAAPSVNIHALGRWSRPDIGRLRDTLMGGSAPSASSAGATVIEMSNVYKSDDNASRQRFSDNAPPSLPPFFQEGNTEASADPKRFQTTRGMVF